MRRATGGKKRGKRHLPEAAQHLGVLRLQPPLLNKQVLLLSSSQLFYFS